MDLIPYSATNWILVGFQIRPMEFPSNTKKKGKDQGAFQVIDKANYYNSILTNRATYKI